jgi:hypothetical protein
MGNAYNNYLGAGQSPNGSTDKLIFKTYNHASRLFVDNNLARSPKAAWMFYVNFNINAPVVGDQGWIGRQGIRDVGLLVKSASLPKFKIKTETMNQYNRKTQVQTQLNYDPVNVEFWDDNSEITNDLWKNYYKYYYSDSTYGDNLSVKNGAAPLGLKEFGDNKFSETSNPYGFDNFQTIPFFDSIDVFVLHQKKFTQFRLVNPLIASWDHDTVSVSEGNKVMVNKMSLVYENVLYYQGDISQGENPPGFAGQYYDTIPGSTVGGNTPNSKNDLNASPVATGPIPETLTPQAIGPSPSQLEKALLKQGGTGMVSQIGEPTGKLGFNIYTGNSQNTIPTNLFKPGGGI